MSAERIMSHLAPWSRAIIVIALAAFCVSGATDAKMSASTTQAFAIQADGTLWAWGNAPLGDGTNVARFTPTRVDAQRAWTNVAAGSGFALAIQTDGSLWGWGATGRLPGTAGNSPSVLVPTRIGTDSDWNYVVAGSSVAAAIKRDGTLWVWGSLGYSSNVTFTAPTQVLVSGAFLRVSAGTLSVYAVHANGSLWRFGPDGVPPGGSILAGVSIPTGPPSGWTDVFTSTDGQTYGIGGDGSLWAWGQNGVGQLGFGDNMYRGTPALLDNTAHWTKVGLHAALRSDGSLWSWMTTAWTGPGFQRPTLVGSGQTWADLKGSLVRNFAGEIYRVGLDYEITSGQGTTGVHAAPTRIGALTQHWQDIAVGQSFASAVNADGSLWSWGSIPHPPDGWSYSSEPALFDASTDWKSLASGQFHTLAIKNDQSLWAWGSNGEGQLGFPFTSSADAQVRAPRRVGSYSDWKSVAATGNRSIGLRTNGTLWTWGDWMFSFTSPVPPANYAPAQLGSDSDWAQVAALSGGLVVGLKADGRIFSIEGGNATQLGHDTDWSFVAAMPVGRYIAQKVNGDVYSWSSLSAGYFPNPNQYGILGDGTTVHRTTPTFIGNFAPILHAAGNESSTHWIDNTGKRVAWTSRQNLSFGGMGVVPYEITTPFAVQTSRQWTAIAQGPSFAVGIADNGVLHTWGKPPGTPTLKSTGFAINPRTASLQSPAFALTPVIHFRNLTVNVPPEPFPVTLTNTGDTPMQISHIMVAPPFGLSHDCPGILAAMATCTINVGISSSVPGIEFTRLHVESDAAVSGNDIEVWAISSDNVPDAFSFATATGAAPGEWQYATPVTISGLSNATSVRATNSARVARNCNTGTPTWSTSALVRSSDALCVRMRASPIPGDQVTTTITVGNGSADFTVRTRDRTPGRLLVSGGYGPSPASTWGACTSMPAADGSCWATDLAYACEVRPGASGTIHNVGAPAFSIFDLQTDLVRDALPWKSTAAARCWIDLDGDGLLRADKDGVAWLRYFAGYTTANLLMDQPAAACATNTASDQQSWLYAQAANSMALAPSEATSTQFGLVLLRAMLGLSGTAATAGTAITWPEFVTKVNKACATNF